MSKTKGVVFTYGIQLKENGVVETFPAVRISFFSKDNEKLSLFLIVDSGAIISALPKSDAEVLGIQPENGFPLSISGIGGERLNGWRHEIMGYLKDRMIQLPVVFIDNEFAPRVLGRAGIFNHFTIIFEEEKQRTGFIEKHSSPARDIQKILDKLQY